MASTNRVVRKKARIGKEQWRGSRAPEQTSNSSGVMSEEIVPAHQNDLDIRSTAKPLQVAGRVDSAKAAAKDQQIVDAHGNVLTAPLGASDLPVNASDAAVAAAGAGAGPEFRTITHQGQSYRLLTVGAKRHVHRGPARHPDRPPPD